MATDTNQSPLALEQRKIVGQLEKEGFTLVDYPLDRTDFQNWVESAQYDAYPNYYLEGLETKHLDHYLGAKFLDLNEGDVYIDIASSLSSPAPDIYAHLHGCEMYRQDLLFPEGINGNVIGGDASDLPLADGFATKLGLHSSFEHFEQQSDIGFVREASRVLKPGGRMVIVPLFLSSWYLVKTDPSVWPEEGMLFEADSPVVKSKEGWKNRFGRFYDAAHLASRVGAALQDLRLTIYVMQNETELIPNCDRKFVAVFEKPE